MLAVPAPSPARTSRADRELEARLRAHIEILASDDFDGREPGTEGEARTLRYLGRQWYDIGLVSGTNDPGNEWFAPVTLVAREPAAESAQFLRKGFRTPIAPADMIVLTSGKRSLVRNAPLLFVGRASGLEFTRNELAGRIAVVLDGDASDSKRQNELLAHGASAVLTVLDGERNIAEVAARRQRSGYALANDALGGDLEAFISRNSMESLLKGTAHSLDALEAAAAKPDFAPITLDVTASLEATTRETTIHTHNLIGKLPGRHPEAGAVLFVAHWDHFGECGESTAEDRICNGAIDNASGVAALTEVARRLVRGPQMDRDIYFLATTAEELGLLGAHAFAENPPLPLDRIVAAFNIDSDAIAPRGTHFAIVGRGMTGLDADIGKVVKAEGFKLRDNDDANEYVRRQDGWALLQHDIPTVMVTTAYGDMDRMRTFFDTDYHRPSDDLAHLAHSLELGGEVEDVKVLTALGRWFADPRKVPLRIAQ
ncbi:M28 family peptidase [Novosphingobium mangrovi (ex Huang et al. 2023)]